MSQKAGTRPGALAPRGAVAQRGVVAPRVGLAVAALVLNGVAGGARAELPPGWSVQVFSGRVVDIAPAGGVLACSFTNPPPAAFSRSPTPVAPTTTACARTG